MSASDPRRPDRLTGYRDDSPPAAARPHAEPRGAEVPVAGFRSRRVRPWRRPAVRDAAPLTAEQRLLILDSWRRSGLPPALMGPSGRGAGDPAPGTGGG